MAYKLASQLRSLLDSDLSGNVIPLTWGGKIHRAHYAKKVGVTPMHLGQACANVFGEYEKKLGNPESIHDHRLPAMRRWLKTQLRTGKLAIRNGKLDRTEFEKHFKLRKGSAGLYPSFKKLLCEFDEHAAAQSYVPKLTRVALARLEAALKAIDCPINDNRVSVSLVPLSRLVGIPAHTLRTPPYDALIRAKDNELLLAAKASKLDCFFFGRPYPFSSLAPPWPTQFIERIAARFKQVFSGKSIATSKDHHRALLKALSWIGDSELKSCRAVVSDAHGTSKMDPDHWEDAVYAYRDCLIRPEVDQSTAHKDIRAVNVAIAALATAGIVPSLSRPLVGIKNARRRAGHLPSVAETPNIKRAGKRTDAYISFAQNALEQARKKFQIDTIVDEEASAFLYSLHLEATRAEQDLPTDPAAAVLLLINRRLQILLHQAQANVEHWMAHQSAGRQILTKATIDSHSFLATYFSASTNKYARTVLLRQSFPPMECRKEEAIANILALATSNFGGLLPATNDVSFGRFFVERYLHYGGLPFLDAYLNPHRDAYGAALTIYLCESGANVSVGRTLALDCIEQSDLPGHKQITGYKARAQGKPIVADLPAKSLSIRALQWIASNGASARISAAPEDADRLFVMRIKGICKAMTESWYTKWFKDFAESRPGLEGLGLVPSMIRPSVLLKAALENDGRLQVGIAIGQHTAQVSKGYQEKWPTRYIYDQRIRAFQELFEVLVVQDIESAAVKMNIPVDVFEKRLKTMQDTGLGTHCANPSGRPGNHGRRCTTLDCWNNCPQLVVLAEVESVALLQIWQAALRVAQPDWERDQPERWDAVWLPWLCLTDVVEEKMVRGPQLRIWNEAKVRRVQIEATLGFVPPRPF